MSGVTGGAPPTASLTFEELESTATTYRRIYESFLGSYMAATQRQSFPISSAQIITRATPPLAQSRSGALILAFGAVVGACAGAVISYLLERRKSDGATSDLLSEAWKWVRIPWQPRIRSSWWTREAR